MAKKPDPKADAKAIRKLQAQKSIDKIEGALDRRAGKDTRMARDGGTSRRTRK